MVYDFKNNFFCNFKIIPTSDMNTEEQIDSLIRLLILLLIILFVVSIFVNIHMCVHTIFILIIIILCYIKENMSNKKENFDYIYPQQNKNFIKQQDNNKQSQISQLGQPIYQRAQTVKNEPVILQKAGSNPFAYDAVLVEPNDTNYVSSNYKFVGGPNPKTLIPPVIVPPIADMSYWKANNITTHSHINDSKNLEVFQSGYEVSNLCGNNTCPSTNNNYDLNKLNSRYKKINQKQEKTNPGFNNKYHQKYFDHQKDTHNAFYDTNSNQIVENFTIEDFDINENEEQDKIENIGLVNKTCSYEKNQFKDYNLPVNLAVGSCQKQNRMKNFNKNLFTQTIQPGVYSVNQVNEPINSNMGISFGQQFEPLTYDVDDEGNINYIEHDPLEMSFDSKENILKYRDNDVIEPVTQSNVYDPRFTGYGTSYRAYNDENIGQTRFFYDDINSIRMPNYVVRSKIDFADFADTYGPMNDKRGNIDNSTIRALANQKFVDDAIVFRTGMQERLMRKHNSDRWQQRSKPIYKNSQRMLSGGRCW